MGVPEVEDLEKHLATLPRLRQAIIPGGREREEPNPTVSLLLGNGWSIALSPKYAYASLLELIKPKVPVWVAELLDRNGVEGGLGAIRAAIDGDRSGLPTGAPQEKAALEAAEAKLRSAFIDAVRYVTEAGNAVFAKGDEREALLKRYSKAWEFIGRFPIVFTTNYDLLLYYVHMRAREEKKAGGWRDGFANPIEDLLAFSGILWGRRHILYLHGALHLVAKPSKWGVKTYKRKRIAPEPEDPDPFDWPILSQVSNDLQQGILPLIVSEGHAAGKLERIKENPYLQTVFQEFRKLRGNILVVGSSFSANDGHLLEALAENEHLLSVTASYHTTDDRDALESRLVRLNEMREALGRRPMELFLIDAKRIPMWD